MFEQITGLDVWIVGVFVGFCFLTFLLGQDNRRKRALIEKQRDIIIMKDEQNTKASKLLCFAMTAVSSLGDEISDAKAALK